MKSYKMPSDSLQALNSDYSELHSPDSLYTKDLSELLPDEIKLKSNNGVNFDLQGTFKLVQDEHSHARDEQTSLRDLMDAYSTSNNQVLQSVLHQTIPDIGQASSIDIEVPPNKVHVKEADETLSQFQFVTGQNLVKDVFTLRQPSPVASPDTTVFSDTNTHMSSEMHKLTEESVVGSSSGDVNTQMSLCQQSEAIRLDSDALKNEQSSLWVLLSDSSVKPEPTSPLATSPLASPHKARKASFDADAPSSQVDAITSSDIFDADSAVSAAQYVFTKFGSEVPGIFTFGGQTTASESSGVENTVTSKAVTSISSTPSNIAAMLVEDDTKLFPPVLPHVKEAPLNTTFPSKAGNIELKVVVQPEEQHRARYMTEGSRGSVKDKSQNAHPVIQLKGYNKPATIKIFIGTDSGRIKPHGFYQACRVCGKNNTPCSERNISGTTVIEVVADPKEDMSVRVDCVGILKLRNADVEQRIGIQRSKKKSTRVRMVFRVDIPRADGTNLTLQTSSTAISCTQPAGQPEVCRKSLSKCCVTGGEELFIIGKNFTKGSKVLFQQQDPDEKVTWSAEAPIDQDYFQPTHLICTVPAYKSENVTDDVNVNLLVQCNDRTSDLVPFTYTRVSEAVVKQEQVQDAASKVTPMETDSQTTNIPTSLPQSSSVSPIAVVLNKLFEQCNTNASNQSAVNLPTILIQSIQSANTTPTTQTNVLSAPSIVQSQPLTQLNTNTMAPTQNIMQNPTQSIIQNPVTVAPTQVNVINPQAVQSNVQFPQIVQTLNAPQMVQQQGNSLFKDPCMSEVQLQNLGSLQATQNLQNQVLLGDLAAILQENTVGVNQAVGVQMNPSLQTQQQQQMTFQAKMDNDFAQTGKRNNLLEETLNKLEHNEQQNISTLSFSQASQQEVVQKLTETSNTTSATYPLQQSESLNVLLDSSEMLNNGAATATTNMPVLESGYQLPSLERGCQAPVLRGSEAQSVLMSVLCSAGGVEASIADARCQIVPPSSTSALCPPTSEMSQLAPGRLQQSATTALSSASSRPVLMQSQPAQVPSASGLGNPFPNLSLQDVETILGITGGNTPK